MVRMVLRDYYLFTSNGVTQTRRPSCGLEVIAMVALAHDVLT